MKRNDNGNEWIQALNEIMQDPEQRERLQKAWAREIKKEERKNPQSAGIDFMKAIRF